MRTVICLLLFVGVAAGQSVDRPDLSGVWALDESRSYINRGVSDYVLTIVHREPEIRMTKSYKQRGGKRSEETIYYTDGRPEFSSVKGHKDSEPVIRWQGNKLVRRSTTMARGGPRQNFPPMEVVTTETWELSPDGKTLTRTIRTGGIATLHLKYVFTRVS